MSPFLCYVSQYERLKVLCFFLNNIWCISLSPKQLPVRVAFKVQWWVIVSVTTKVNLLAWLSMSAQFWLKILPGNVYSQMKLWRNSISGGNCKISRTCIILSALSALHLLFEDVRWVISFLIPTLRLCSSKTSRLR